MGFVLRFDESIVYEFADVDRHTKQRRRLGLVHAALLKRMLTNRTSEEVVYI